MAEIIKVFPKTICSDVRFTEDQLNYLLDFLSSCTVDYGGNESLRKAGEYVSKDLFPLLEKLSQDIRSMK